MDYRIDEIETFLIVMELGTVTAAAARLSLSKSVVSKRISDFENRVNAALFRRNAGRITPTDVAYRLAERLRPALTELVAAAESASWDADGTTSLRGQLSISAPMSFGVVYLSPVIAQFAERHPDLEIRVDYDDRARDLSRDGFDVGIRIGPLGDSALRARQLCEDRLYACASPAYLDRHGRPEHPDDLAQHSIIGYNNVPDSQTWQFAKDGVSHTAPVQRRYSLNNGQAMTQLAIQGLGIVMLPGFTVAAALEEGLLEHILTGYEGKVLPITAVWPPVSPMPAKLRSFIDHLLATIKADRLWAQH